MIRLIEWPDWLPGYERYESPLYHRRLDSPPTVIVLHSGARSPRVAEYLHALPDGREVSCHFAWRHHDAQLVQMVSLRKRAQHAGRLGNHCIGIELSGPWYQRPRHSLEIAQLRQLIEALQSAFAGTLTHWIRHSELDPARKKDPGPGLLDGHMVGFGLEHATSDVIAK